MKSEGGVLTRPVIGQAKKQMTRPSTRNNLVVAQLTFVFRMFASRISETKTKLIG